MSAAGPRYSIRVTFKSNEHPWSSEYQPYRQPDGESEAIKWAAYMAAHLPDYMVTLYRDGRVVPLPAGREEAA